MKQAASFPISSAMRYNKALDLKQLVFYALLPLFRHMVISFDILIIAYKWLLIFQIENF